MCQIIDLNQYRLSRRPTISQQREIRDMMVRQMIMDELQDQPYWLVNQACNVASDVLANDGSLNDVMDAVERVMKINKGVSV